MTNKILPLHDLSFPGLISSPIVRKKRVAWHLQVFTDFVNIISFPRKRNESNPKNKPPPNKNLFWKRIPLELVWVQESQLHKNEEDELVARATSFELIVPNQVMVLGTGSLEEREKWINEMKKLINRRLKEIDLPADSEMRKASFTFAGIGTYDGKWFKGQMHGEGTFSSTDNTIKFEGHWNHILSAGIGTKTEGEVTTEHVGWEYTFPFSGITKHIESLDESRKKRKSIDLGTFESELSSEDIKLITNSKISELLHYNPGDIILKESEKRNYIFCLRSGTFLFWRSPQGEDPQRRPCGR